MSLSLRDQLLQAGLLDTQKAKQASKDQHQQRREQAKRPPGVVDPRILAEQRAAEAKAARDLELNRQLQQKQEQKARRAQIKQLVEQNRVAKLADSDELYNFVDGKKIRRLPVDRPMREKLVSGQFAIVRSDGRYEIVPAETAERIRERDPLAVVSHNTAAPAKDDSDPYKDHVVPDDLMW